jgi:LDH2 family malate/lactate/ureidoglycolate dehydrogenase
MSQSSKTIKLSDLKKFCQASLIDAGMSEENAEITAEVLAETDAYGTHSHGTVNLAGYIKKAKVGGLDIKAEPVLVKEGLAFAIMDGQNGMGMVPAYRAMALAIEKAKLTGIALVTVKNSTHYGAAGYYANMAAAQDMFGISMSNVDPNMTAPGARGMLIGNNPLAYAAPAGEAPSISLDIALSNVASLKVVKARKEGKSIPDTWVVDKDGLPTTDPSHYPEEGAVQPMAAHKGYGLAVMVELLTGALSGGGMSMLGDIVSWLFEIEAPNNVCHTFIAIDIDQFVGKENFIERADAMAAALHDAPKAKGADRIYTPGEMEWENHQKAEAGLALPANVVESLEGLQAQNGIAINWIKEEA